VSARAVTDSEAAGRAWPNRFGLVAVRLLPLVALFVATGAALVLAIVLSWSLPAALLLTVGTAGTLSVIALRRAPRPVRLVLVHRLRVGLLAGLAATAAYDAARFGIVSALSLSFKPFHALGVFGEMLVGSDAPPGAIAAAGIAYHVTNGVTFSIAYTLLFRRPSVWTALLWAAMLEAFMITLYPGWLDVKRVDELAFVSILGHIAFGLTLGAISRRLVKSRAEIIGGPVPPPPPRADA
jgi:hypothetical protein